MAAARGNQERITQSHGQSSLKQPNNQTNRKLYKTQQHCYSGSAHLASVLVLAAAAAFALASFASRPPLFFHLVQRYDPKLNYNHTTPNKTNQTHLPQVPGDALARSLPRGAAPFFPCLTPMLMPSCRPATSSLMSLALSRFQRELSSVIRCLRLLVCERSLRPTENSHVLDALE